MKAKRLGKNKVLLTLENQTEIDGIYAFINHTVLRGRTGIPNCFEVLKPFRSSRLKTDALHDELNNLLK